jgi:hypothetical protein
MTTEYADISRQYSSDKIFVEAMAIMHKDGRLKPIEFLFEGRKIKIDRVLSVLPMAATKGGGPGNRYTCMASGRQFHLFFDTTRWYIKK